MKQKAVATQKGALEARRKNLKREKERIETEKEHLAREKQQSETDKEAMTRELQQLRLENEEIKAAQVSHGHSTSTLTLQREARGAAHLPTSRRCFSGGEPCPHRTIPSQPQQQGGVSDIAGAKGGKRLKETTHEDPPVGTRVHTAR
ncbi:hypothetical protein QBC32DRAFT_352436 [Pseudoneurospora amorphoporcata]|uniref:Uncharacterized protein n=1 Tax=Pseudoneurospora amorphoporcata TaxID=241081 RepID=A0AAN6NQ31_9PEZI|nr:hypothetical protein QBC32DRAFT_352436 [Pseudoneurospora amorphoporcata]